MNVETITKLVTSKTAEPPAFYDDSQLAGLEDFLEQPYIADYLRHCLPREVIEASGMRISPLEYIQNEMVEGAAPGSFIRPYGYIVVATSVGGNVVCLHSPSGKVFWADHTSFHSDHIAYKDRTTAQWKYLYEYSPENVEKALVLLSDNIESFLVDMLEDRLDAQLDALD